MMNIAFLVFCQCSAVRCGCSDDGVFMMSVEIGVAVHACRRGGVGPGKKVAILGAGPIGKPIMPRDL